MCMTNYKPIPVIDTLEDMSELYKSAVSNDEPRKILRKWLNHCFVGTGIVLSNYASKDFHLILQFLYSYRGSKQTYNAYRRELERLIQWSWFVRKSSVTHLKRDDIEVFVEFCIKPYKRWIGLKTVARFKKKDGGKVPNPEWRPFEASIPKKDVKNGMVPTKDDYSLSQKAIQALFAITGSFYQYLLQEEVITANPVTLIRQKSKFIQKETKQRVIRRLSNRQWEVVINIAREQAEEDIAHERTVFILSLLFGMYLRISELTSKERWTPTMGDFYKDNEGNWWFKTVGKGNKARTIAVSPAMMKALKHYRKTYLNLPPLPPLDDETPLIGHIKNANRPITDERPIRYLIQTCFDQAADYLEQTDPEEAETLRVATVHWLRHTGISEDVKTRPREHVRDDAGHSSSAITDRYIDVELRERAKTARGKSI